MGIFSKAVVLLGALVPLSLAQGGPRIVGGSETTPFEFPWIGALAVSNSVICGGSLIACVGYHCYLFIFGGFFCFFWICDPDIRDVCNVLDLWRSARCKFLVIIIFCVWLARNCRGDALFAETRDVGKEKKEKREINRGSMRALLLLLIND
jgi:hypothetical protein